MSAKEGRIEREGAPMTPAERRRGSGWLATLASSWGVQPITDGERLQLRPAKNVPARDLPALRAAKPVIVKYLVTRREELTRELEQLSILLEPYELVHAFEDPEYQELLQQFGEVLHGYQLFCVMAPEVPAATGAAYLPMPRGM